MSRYILIRRLRGPAVLLLIGVLALLYQMGAVSHFWRLFWPLLLILMGVLLLAERAVLAEEGYPFFGGGPWDGANYPIVRNPDPGSPGAGQSAAPGTPANPEQTSTAIVPAHDFGKHLNGGEQ